MIKKLYDFRQTAVPAALLQAEVTGEEISAELHLAAARFTAIEAVNGPVCGGDVVTLEFADSKAEGGVRRIYANVGKGFNDVEEQLPGLCVGDAVEFRYAGQNVKANIVCVKRPTVPALTDERVQQLGIENVANLAAFEGHVFLRLAEGQRKRKFRGIMGIVSKAMMENTEFEDLMQHPWFLALHEVMMGRVAAFAAQEGKSVDEALPSALRMDGKPLAECRQALKEMCLERAKQGALGQAYAKENGVEITAEGEIADLVGQYVDYLNEVVYQYFAPKIQVERK